MSKKKIETSIKSEILQQVIVDEKIDVVAHTDIVEDDLADKKLEEARNNITKAYKNLLEFLDIDCPGQDIYKRSHVNDIHKIARKLLKLKSKI